MNESLSFSNPFLDKNGPVLLYLLISFFEFFVIFVVLYMFRARAKAISGLNFRQQF